jgi:hypothetical protein
LSHSAKISGRQLRATEQVYIDKLVSGIGDFLQDFGPGEKLYEKRHVLWCYRYQYDTCRLGWGRIRSGFPASLAKPIVEAVSKRWPTLPDAYDRPMGSKRTQDAPLGAPWPVYLARKADDSDPVEAPLAIEQSAGGSLKKQ